MSAPFADPRDANYIASANQPHAATLAADYAHLGQQLARSGIQIDEVAKAVAHDGRRWLAVPFSIVGNTFAYRKSWFEEVGYAEFPRTWDQFRDAGRKLKAKGRPLGQTLGQTFGDAPTFTYPLLWSFGGKEVEADGRTVVLNSPDNATVNFNTGPCPLGNCKAPRECVATEVSLLTVSASKLLGDVYRRSVGIQIRGN